jgi:hypothetical protein
VNCPAREHDFDWRYTRREEQPMLDVIMLAIALGFFVLSVGYTIACDRL